MKKVKKDPTAIAHLTKIKRTKLDGRSQTYYFTFEVKNISTPFLRNILNGNGIGVQDITIDMDSKEATIEIKHTSNKTTIEVLEKMQTILKTIFSETLFFGLNFNRLNKAIAKEVT